MAPETLHLAGHRVGMALPTLAARGRGDSGAGGECGAHELLCVFPAVATKLFGDSCGSDGSCSNMAVHMTDLTFSPTDGFWGRFIVVLWAGGEGHLPFLSFYN